MIGCADTEAVDLALAFYRKPTGFPDLIRGRAKLPDQLSGLLKLAALDPDCPGSVSEPGGGSTSGELRSAALYFIDQVLFRHDANHYRLLGLNPGASFEKIKEHHRLLMRLFHPDRENAQGCHDGICRGSYASRLNQAYGVLRDQAARSQYLALLEKLARPAMQGVAGNPESGVRKPRVLNFREKLISSASLLFRWHLPELVLSGVAILAVGVVWIIYLANSNPGVRDGGADPPAGFGAQWKYVGAGQELSAFERRLPLSWTTGSEAYPGLGLYGKTESKVEGVSYAGTGPENPSANGQVYGPVSLRQQKHGAVLDRTAQATALTRQHWHADALVHWMPEKVLAGLSHAYAQGDVEAAMALFDQDVLTDAGDYEATRKELLSLFARTDLRYLRFNSMSWSPEGMKLSGTGSYHYALVPKDESLLETHSGTVQLDLVNHGRDVRIASLHLRSDK